MTQRSWFTSRVRQACIVENVGCTMTNDSIFVFRASGFDEAFSKALSLGRNAEEEYSNSAGQIVRWRLKEIVSLDIVQAETLDGAEVYSEFDEFEPPQAVDVEEKFEPEKSKPTQTI